MKRMNRFLVAIVLLAVAFFTLSAGVSAQGLIIIIEPTVAGTLGEGGWYVSDVAVTWPLPENATYLDGTCQDTLIQADTPPEGIELTCIATADGNTYGGGITIKRDATPPSIDHDLPVLEPLYLPEGSSIEFHALCSDAVSGCASLAWDTDDDGVFGDVLGEAVTLEYQDEAGLIMPMPVVGVEATDQAGNTATATGDLFIFNVEPSAVLVLEDGLGQEVDFHLGGETQVKGSCTDPGPLDVAAGHTLSIDWGDDTLETLAAICDGSQFVFASHVYLEPGDYAVSVVVTDKDLGEFTEPDLLVAVPPPQTSLDIPRDYIWDELYLGGVLNEGQATSLDVELTGAISDLDREYYTPAVYKLEAFGNHVHALDEAEILEGEVPQFQVVPDIIAGMEAAGLVMPKP